VGSDLILAGDGQGGNLRKANFAFNLGLALTIFFLEIMQIIFRNKFFYIFSYFLAIIFPVQTARAPSSVCPLFLFCP
jgi:hypothetical protein